MVLLKVSNMEQLNNKVKKVIALISTGILILLLFTGFEFLYSYYLYPLGLWANIISALISGIAWWMIIGTGNILYEENKSKWLVCLKLVSIVGFVFCIVRLFFVVYSYINGIENTDQLLIELYTVARNISSYTWLNRFFSICRFGLVSIKILTVVCLVWSLNASVREEFKLNKKFKVLGIINTFLVFMLGMLFIYCFDTYFFCAYALIYIVWLLVYISNMKAYINVSEDSNNGSIFNRIPEEEYQEYLSKMK